MGYGVETWSEEMNSRQRRKLRRSRMATNPFLKSPTPVSTDALYGNGSGLRGVPVTTAYESTLVSVRTIERVSAGDLIYFLSPECIWQLGVADGNGGYVTHGKLFGLVAKVGPSEPLPGTYGALTRRTW